MESEDFSENISADPINEIHTALNTGTGSIKSSGEVELSGNNPIELVEGPVGIDMGTSRIVKYHKSGSKYEKQSELNAFYSVPYSRFTEDILKQNKMLFKRSNNDIFIVGNSSEDFANISNGEISRPMASGLINPREKNGTMIIKEIIKSMISRPGSLGEKLCFSAPAPVRGSNNYNPVFHDGIIKNQLISMGYLAKGVNEGYLVVLAELAKDNYTGIGISCGGGLCNVCLSYLSVPVLSFSMTKAGDYIDGASGQAIGEQANRVRVIKEKSLNLITGPKDRVEKALYIYYEEMITCLIRDIKEAMEESDRIPKINKPIPLVLSGGTAKPEGFRDKFDDILRESNFPIDISEVRLADDPTFTIAKGAYLAACAED